MATSQLSIYNQALLALKERPLTSLSETGNQKRALDEAYDGAIKYCLEEGMWTFAIRASKITADTTFVRSFGYKYRFVQPSDYVNLNMLCYDEYFNSQITRYVDEAGNWYSDVDTMYVSYVSNDVNYGSNMARWPESFVSFVALYLADQTSGRITGKEGLVTKDYEEAKRDALAKDGMKLPVTFRPSGKFVNARRGSTMRDRGSRTNLIG